MRLLHTSDWHLGHQLHGQGRVPEHAAFLAWLGERLVEERIELLLITGDVFDHANPPAEAEKMWFDFLARAKRQSPGLRIVVIAGNHDSPARLGASAAVLGIAGVHVVTSLDDRDAAMVRFPELTVVAVPYLRAHDLAHEADPTGAVRSIYASMIEEARRLGRPLVVTGHLFVAGAMPSLMSERRVISGGEEALPSDLFPADVGYVALGHLHRAQRIGGHEHVRYAGSPIPLATNEATYRHSVVVAEVGDGAAEVRTLEVPRLIPLLRVPARGAATLTEVIAELRAFADDHGDPALRPFLEVAVALDAPEPRLRAQVEEALEGRWPRLIKITPTYTGHGRALADDAAGHALADLDPRDVLVRRWQRDHEGAPPQPLLDVFDRLVDELRAEGRP